MTLEIEHRQRFALCPETFWRELCLSLAYQERLFCEALGFRSMEVLENTGSYEQGTKRRLRLRKPLEAPAAVTKLFGSEVTLEEHSEFDPAAQCLRYRMVPAILADRIDIHGTVRLRVDASAVEQLGSTSLTCRLFGLGGIVEPFMARSTEQSNADKAAFTLRYIEEKQLR